MGAQQVLREFAYRGLIVGVGVIAGSGVGHAAPHASGKERAAVIDLGPPDANVRRKLAASLVDAGLEPVLGDGVEDALAGIASDRDAVALAAAMADAERAFGALDCKATVAATQLALPILAARQAGGVAVPELPRAWSYVLLCADRGGDVDLAMRAAHGVRATNATGVPAALLAKYPEVDAMVGGDAIAVDITADLAGASLWIDFAPVGTVPAHVVLSAGEHVIAAAKGSARGVLTGTVVPSQTSLAVTLEDQGGPWGLVAARVASWHGKLPSPDELAWVLGKVHARAALVRHGDVVEVWGHAGAAEPPRRLGGEDGVRALADSDRAAALLADRAEGWSSHAPDPDQPLLVEDIRTRGKGSGAENEPTKWWVYATIGAAIAAGVTVIYLHRDESSTQHVELHYP